MTATRRDGKVAAMAQPSADLIRGVPLFAELDDKTVDRLAGEFIERQFAPGAAIATEGEGGLNFFIVESGTAEVSVGGDDGRARSVPARRSARSRSSTSRPGRRR